MIIIGLENQTVFDICIKYYGSLEALSMLSADNPNILTETITGRIIKIRTEVINLSIVDYFAKKQITTY